MRTEPQARILIVDDDLANAQLLARLFDEEYEVTCVSDGKQALDLAGRSAPDVILLDVMMPGMDGFEVCSRLKANHDTGEIPVILMTGMDRSDAETRGLALGAVDYVTKPVDPQVIERRVRNQVELVRARDRLTRLASTDGLTGIHNRRHFDEMLSREYARLARAGGVLSLILLDIDHFKAFNDTYGHVRGDECLRAIAHALVGSMYRAADIAARYGGEEFACILPDTSEDGARATAERIRTAIAVLRIPHRASPTAEYVTASFGVATERCRPGRSELALLARADEQLYLAKASNRNSICATLPLAGFGHH